MFLTQFIAQQSFRSITTRKEGVEVVAVGSWLVAFERAVEMMKPAGKALKKADPIAGLGRSSKSKCNPKPGSITVDLRG
jgi:hypothetical protein